MFSQHLLEDIFLLLTNSIKDIASKAIKTTGSLEKGQCQIIVPHNNFPSH